MYLKRIPGLPGGLQVARMEERNQTRRLFKSDDGPIFRWYQRSWAEVDAFEIHFRGRVVGTQ